MDPSPRSPKRRKILSSMNREPDNISYHPETSGIQPANLRPGLKPQDHSYADDQPDKSTEREPRTTKMFRFKSKRSSPSSRRSASPRQDKNPARKDGSRRHCRHGDEEDRHRHHHRRRRRHRSRSPIPAGDENEDGAPGQDAPRTLSPNSAFRESLFDAMADDEGAAYWEGVYGQPIHIYERPSADSGPDGELERMTDDEYAAFVRRRMWEKTHAGLLEERARRAREAEEQEAREREARRIAEEMERSLRKGRERVMRKAWRERWAKYLAKWMEISSAAVDDLPWPTESGTRGEVAAEGGEAVRSFFVRALDLEGLGEREFATRLKEERVRWHPDKIQQRFGGAVDEAVMRDVTAIFQAIDRLWNDTRTKE